MGMFLGDFDFLGMGFGGEFRDKPLNTPKRLLRSLQPVGVHFNHSVGVHVPRGDCV